jgi:hypothetical protein
MRSKGKKVRIGGVCASAPTEVDRVGRGILAKFKHNKTVSYHSIATLAGVTRVNDRIRGIAQFLAATGYCEIKQKPFATSSHLELASRWGNREDGAWKKAYTQWCKEWNLEVPS